MEDYTFQAELHSLLSKCSALSFHALAEEVELCGRTLDLRMGQGSVAKAAPRALGPPPPVPIRGAIQPTPGADLFGAAGDFDLKWHQREGDSLQQLQGGLGGGGAEGGWGEHRDEDTGRAFFFNRTSGETTWERPADTGAAGFA